MDVANLYVVRLDIRYGQKEFLILAKQKRSAEKLARSVGVSYQPDLNSDEVVTEKLLANVPTPEGISLPYIVHVFSYIE